MWVKKFHKDATEDSRTPIPTQVVSNEEYLPRPQTPDQKKVEAIIHEMAEKYGKKVGLSRRDFLKTTNGMALAFVAMNQVFGKYFEAHADELTDISAISEFNRPPRQKSSSARIILRILVIRLSGINTSNYIKIFIRNNNFSRRWGCIQNR